MCMQCGCATCKPPSQIASWPTPVFSLLPWGVILYVKALILGMYLSINQLFLVRKPDFSYQDYAGMVDVYFPKIDCLLLGCRPHHTEIRQLAESKSGLNLNLVFLMLVLDRVILETKC